MPIIIKDHNQRAGKNKFSFHQSPLFQKLLIVVLFTAAISVIYARAATTVGSNISTDGTLTVTGTTTLSSILSVNDINVALSGASDVGLNITGTVGTGIQTTRPITIQPTDGLNYPIIARVASGGYGITAEGPSGGNLVGYAYGFYVDGIDGSGSSAFAMGNVGLASTAENSFGVFVSYVNQGSTGFFIEDTGGTGFKSQHVFADDVAIGFMADKKSSGSGFSTLFKADLSNASTKGKGVSIITGNANDIGMDISGSLGTGIQTTRPINITGSGNLFIDSVEIDSLPYNVLASNKGKIHNVNISSGVDYINLPADASAGDEFLFVNIVDDTFTIDAGAGSVINYGNTSSQAWTVPDIRPGETYKLRYTGGTDWVVTESFNQAYAYNSFINQNVTTDGSPTFNTHMYLKNIQAASQDVGTSLYFQGEESLLDMGSINSFWTGNDNLNTYLSFVNRNAGIAGERMRITSDGKIGIGTTTPAKKLHIVDTGSIGGLQIDGYDADNIVSIGTTGEVSNAILNIVDSLGGNVLFKTTATGGRSFIIDPSGNVAIGTTTPSSIFHVSNGTATSTITIGDASSEGKGACLKLRDSDDAGWSYCSILDGTLGCSSVSCE